MVLPTTPRHIPTGATTLSMLPGGRHCLAITGSAHSAVPFASYYKSCLIFSLKDGPDPEATTAM